MTTTWLAGGIILLTGEQLGQKSKEWLKAFGLALGGSLVLAFFLWVFHATNLVNIANSSPQSVEQLIAHLHRTAGLVVWYYIVLLLLLSFLALFLPENWPPSANMEQDIWQPLVAVVVLIAVLITIGVSNVNNIRANMVFKMGEPLAGDQYQVASYIFEDAVKIQPKEDFYYLYLGRSYLEQAKAQEEATKQDQWVQRAEQTLQTALRINPLNTDHSANLARMFSWWYSRSADDQTRLVRGEQAVNYYTQALGLSPNSAPLWTEKANALLNLGRNDEAQQALLKATELDRTYVQAHGLLGELYMRQAQSLSDPELITQTYELAAEYFGQGGAGKGDLNARISYYAQQGNIYLKIGNPEKARDAFLAALALSPGASIAWQLEETLARVSVELNDKAAALAYAQSALDHAPAEQSAGVQQLIEQIQSMP